jgi:hypothetical protein
MGMCVRRIDRDLAAALARLEPHAEEATCTGPWNGPINGSRGIVNTFQLKRAEGEAGIPSGVHLRFATPTPVRA